jgi:predicted nucleotidyltransferase
VTLPGPERLLASLVSNGVDFVVIGGLAAVAHGSRRMTRDIDIVVRPENDNLTRLEATLAELKAVQLVADGGQQPITPADVATVALGTTLHTRSPAGMLDVVGAPIGAAPYPELRARSVMIRIGDVDVPVSGLDDLIAMKRAAGRPLDLQDIADVTAHHPLPGDERPS